MEFDLQRGLHDLSGAPRLTPEPVPAHRVMARVHRTRVVRTVGASAAGLAAVVGLGVAVQAAPWTGEDPVPPATTTDAPTPEPSSDPTPTPTVEPTPEETPAPEVPAEPEPDEPPSDALPPGFPDPASLIGQEVQDSLGAEGPRLIVAGEAVNLTLNLSFCFDGGTDDMCAFSISAYVPPGPDGAIAPSEVGLVLLTRSTGRTADDGAPIWQVVDAIATRTPDGEPAFYATCAGPNGLQPAYGSGLADATVRFPVAAAWGPNADASALVEADPSTCQMMGH